MIFTETDLQGAYIIDVEPIKDHRGFFARGWCRRELEDQGLKPQIAQCNLSFNHFKGTIRGMHYQVIPFREVKLVRCFRGAIYDVIIDLRTNSANFKSWFGIELSEENRRMLYVPEGFAHGYQTLTDNCEVFYQVSEYYQPNHEQGIRWNDPAFDIKWPLHATSISDKDKSYPDFEK